MKKSILSILILPLMVFSVESITATQRPSKPITKPTRPITIPVRPIVRPVVNQDNYYNTNVVNSCEQYINSLNQKDQEIEALKKEITSLRNKEQSKIQKSLKEEYEQGLKDFENRHSDSTTKSRAIISDKPID